MDNIQFTVNYSDFNKALKDYLEITGKSLADALNRCAKNISIQAVKGTKKASPSNINLLKKETKFVWWLALKIKKEKDGGYEATNQKNFLRTGVYLSHSKSKSFEDAIKVINRRKSATSFMQAFFVEMSKAVDGKGSGKSFSGIVPNFTKATEESQKAEIGVKFDYKREKKISDSAEAILYKTLQKGIDGATKDMRDYMLKKLQEAGNRVSPK